MSRRYPPEFHAWMREYIPGHSSKEISAEALRRFDISISPSAVKSYKMNHKIPSGTPCGITRGAPTKLFPAEVLTYVLDHYEGVGPKEMAARLNEKFNKTYTREQLKALYHNHKLDSGLTGRFEEGHIPPNKGKKGMQMPPAAVLTQFKPDHTPHNKTPIGTIRKKTDGYLWRKTGEGARDWKQLHILNWEEVHGPLPEGQMLIFLDGDHENCAVENLLPVTNKINLEMNRSHLRMDDAELTRTASQLAELNTIIHDKKRKKKK